jgi:hypothetical protein
MMGKWIRSRPGQIVSACVVMALCGRVRAAQSGAAKASPEAHHIKTVFIILMENHNWTGDGNLDIKGNSAAPYINKTLLPIASHAEHYYNPPQLHPSLPNYLWLEAGANFGILNDRSPSHNHQSTSKHLVALLKNENIPWISYQEDISGKVCPLADEGAFDQSGSQLYAPKHNPFVYFDDVTDHLDKNSSGCIAHLRPFTQLAEDLKANRTAAYNFITPNLCDDMHDDCAGNPVAHGDAWLSQHVPDILESAAYKSGGVLFITWDEADKDDGPIGMIVLSPFAKGNGYSNALSYTHGSTLRTLQEIFVVQPLLGDATQQQDLSDLFRVFP